MTVFFDIDGTLTRHQKIWDEPRNDMMDECRRLIAEGHNVVVWSRTRRYAKAFCRKHGLKPLLAIGKPDMIVDNQKRKWGGKFQSRTITPEEFLKKMEAGNGKES